MALTKVIGEGLGTVTSSLTLSGATTVGGVLTANAGVVFNESSADVDFRVESNGNANMLLVDGGNDRVAVGSVSGTAGTFNVNAGGSDGAGAYRILNTTDGVTTNFVVKTDNSASTNVCLIGPETSSAFAFMMGGSEKMRIDTGSRLAFGNTDTNAKITVSQNGNALNLMRLQNTDSTNNARFIQFANSSNSDCGHIDQVNATTIAYNTTSDYRLKQNIDYTFDATTEVKKLKPCTFSWKHDDTDKSVYGFLAHEVSEIVSEAVSGTKDATRDIGTIKSKDGDITAKNAPQAQANTDENETWEKTGTENVYQGYDPGKLVPLLVKTIQELEARIAKLESS
jgi:hypothetical protein